MMDMRSFSLGLILSMSLMLVLLFVILQRVDRERGFWALQGGCIAAAASVLLLIFQVLGWPVLTYVLANALVVLSMVLFWQGFLQWTTGKSLPWLAWLPPLLMLPCAYWFTLVSPDIGARIVILNSLLLVPLLGLSFFLWRNAPGQESVVLFRLLSIATLWMALASLVRIVSVIADGRPEVNLLDASWPHALPYLAQLLGLAVFVMLTVMSLVHNLIGRLRLQASQDPLTGLLNRVGLRERLDRRLAGTERNRTQCALMMLDLDHFKQVNDRHGHDAGDEVLKRLAEIMKRLSGPGDLPARIGGEEFLLVSFSERPRDQAEVIRRAMAEPDPELPDCTVSIGLVSRFELGAETFRAAFKRADDALYLAKSNGRNRIETLGLD